MTLRTGLITLTATATIAGAAACIPSGAFAQDLIGDVLAAPFVAADALIGGPYYGGYYGWGPGYAYAPTYAYGPSYAYAPGYAWGGSHWGWGGRTYGPGYAYSPNYGPVYSPSPSYAYAGGPAYASETTVTSDSSYCASRYRSYDPASGTFLGFDGLRHPCR